MYRYSSVSLLFLAILFVLACNNVKTSDIENNVDPILKELNEKIASDSKNAELFRQRAEYYANHEKLNDALSDVSKAIEIEPGKPGNFLTASDVYILMGKPQQALDAINKAITLNDTSTVAYLRKARLYMIMKDYEHCAETVEKVFSLDPQNAEGFYLKGFVLAEYGDTLKAIDAYRRAVQYDQQHFEALMQLGSLFTKKDPAMATAYFENALKADPKSMVALYNLGLLFQENGKPGEALKMYAEMLKINPTNRFALYNSGYVNLVYLQDFTKAIDFFSRAFQSDSTYADALFNRGYAYELSGDLPKARKDYDKVLKISINHPKAIEGLNRLDARQR